MIQSRKTIRHSVGRETLCRKERGRERERERERARFPECSAGRIKRYFWIECGCVTGGAPAPLSAFRRRRKSGQAPMLAVSQICSAGKILSKFSGAAAATSKRTNVILV